MPLRIGRLWKPCKDCGVMVEKYTRRQITCQDCKEGIKMKRIKKQILTLSKQKKSKTSRKDKCLCKNEKIISSKRCWDCHIKGRHNSLSKRIK